MPKTEAKKRANNKWDTNNMKMVAVKLRKEEAEEFEAVCNRNGTTRMAVLRQAVRDYIAANALTERTDSDVDCPQHQNTI